MSLPRALTVVALAVAVPGCLGDCPYMVDAIAVSARSPAWFDVANATLAEQALGDLGFEVDRQGLHVEAQKSALEVVAQLDGGGTWIRLRFDIGHHEFRTHEAASAYVETRRAEAMGEINATLEALESKLDWPAFVQEPAEGSIAIC